MFRRERTTNITVLEIIGSINRCIVINDKNVSNNFQI